jgi:hypothetical protein
VSNKKGGALEVKPLERSIFYFSTAALWKNKKGSRIYYKKEEQGSSFLSLFLSLFI